MIHVFPVVDGTDLDDEEVELLSSRGIRVETSWVVQPEKGTPRLPTTPVNVNGQSRYRGKPSSTIASRRALLEIEQERVKAVEERKKKKEDEKAESLLMDSRPKTRSGRSVQAVKTVNESLEEVLMRSHDIRIEIGLDEKVGEFERYLSIDIRGTIYVVTLGQEPSCSCTTFRKMERSRNKWKHCEHLYAIMYRGLHMVEKLEKTEVLLIHQPSFTKREALKMCNTALDKVALDG